MPLMKMLVPDVSELKPSLVLFLWDGFTGGSVLAGSVTAQVGSIKPLFQKSPSVFVFGNVNDGSYLVSVQSAPDQLFYQPVSIPLALPFPKPVDGPWNPEPLWPAFPDLVLADPDKMLNDSAQTAAYLGQRALATLAPTTAYPFPSSATLVRGTVTSAGVNLSGALVTTSLIAQPGTFQVIVVNPDDAASTAQTLTVVNAPVIDSLDPATVIAGVPGFSLIVQGSGFRPGATLHWNGAPIPATFLSSGAVTAQVTAAQVAAVSLVTLDLVNPNGTVSNQLRLAVAAAPAITSIDHPAVTAGSSSFTLDVLGSGFAGTALVQLNGIPLLTTWVSSTHVKAHLAAAQVAAPALLNVAVIDPGPPVQSSNTLNLSVVSTPVLNLLDPAEVVQGSPNFTLTINGSGFVSGAVVKLGAVALPTQFHTPWELTAQITSAQVAALGPVNITVANPAGPASNSQTFTVIAAPTLSSVTPAALAPGNTAFTLVAHGSGFVSGSVIEFNGNALNTVFIDSTELDAHVPRSGYTTGDDGTFVLFFDSVTGRSQLVSLTVSHPSFPKPKSTDVTVVRGATVSVNVDMSS